MLVHFFVFSQYVEKVRKREEKNRKLYTGSNGEKMATSINAKLNQVLNSSKVFKMTSTADSIMLREKK